MSKKLSHIHLFLQHTLDFPYFPHSVCTFLCFTTYTPSLYFSVSLPHTVHSPSLSSVIHLSMSMILLIVVFLLCLGDNSKRSLFMIAGRSLCIVKCVCVVCARKTKGVNECEFYVYVVHCSV